MEECVASVRSECPLSKHPGLHGVGMRRDVGFVLEGGSTAVVEANDDAVVAIMIEKKEVRSPRPPPSFATTTPKLSNRCPKHPQTPPAVTPAAHRRSTTSRRCSRSQASTWSRSALFPSKQLGMPSLCSRFMVAGVVAAPQFGGSDYSMSELQPTELHAYHAMQHAPRSLSNTIRCPNHRHRGAWPAHAPEGAGG